MPTAWWCRVRSRSIWPKRSGSAATPLPTPKILVVCGSEACSGGLFAGSRAVDRTFFDTHAADLWLPGAPTHPMTFIDGILNLLGKKKRE